MSKLTGSRTDKIDCAILEELQMEARISFSELGRRVGLSTPAVIERVRRLEEARVILGYRADLDYGKLGMPVRAFIKVTVVGDKLLSFASIAQKLPEVLECHRVTGAESFIVQIAVQDVEHMERVIDSLMPYVSTNTSLIMASPVRSRTVVPRCQEDLQPEAGRTRNLTTGPAPERMTKPSDRSRERK